MEQRELTGVFATGLTRRICLLCGVFLISTAAWSAELYQPSSRSISVTQRVAPSMDAQLRKVGLRLGDPIFIRIFKESSELEVWVQGPDRTFKLFKTYPICRYSGDLGPKRREGDRQSPEGFYTVAREQLNPRSAFHLSFDLGYPNFYDRARSRNGSLLMIHGGCASIGCYAMTDAGIEEIYTLAQAALDHSQAFFRVHAFPFRMTDQAMRRHSGSKWAGFWNRLKDGYDHFERTRRPPTVGFVQNEYEINDGN